MKKTTAEIAEDYARFSMEAMAAKDFPEFYSEQQGRLLHDLAAAAYDELREAEAVDGLRLDCTEALRVIRDRRNEWRVDQLRKGA